MTYYTALVVGTNLTDLENEIIKLENEKIVRAGLTVLCDVCRKYSVISYSMYYKGAMFDYLPGDATVMGVDEYYASLLRRSQTTISER